MVDINGTLRRGLRRGQGRVRRQLHRATATSARRSPSRSTASWSSTCGAARRTRPARRRGSEDTIINVFSTTKTMSCLSLLVLASRGLVDVDAPVERYWPEFGANGKGNVLVRHLLSHTAGLPAWEQRIETDRPVRLGQGLRAARRAGDVVGAGLEVRLPRHHARATSSARWSAASTAARSARSSPRRSPGRSAPTSTSAPRPSATTASPS